MALLGNDGPGLTAGYAETGAKECKPDYQKMAVQLKDVMDKKRHLLDSLETCLEKGIIQSHTARNQTTLYEVVGVLQIDRIVQMKEYERLLEIIEKEKADGTK